MQPLKETKVYIPIDVNVEVPKVGEYVNVIIKYSDDDTNTYESRKIFLGVFQNAPVFNDIIEGDKVTYWLKEQTGYFLTKQEMLLFKRQFALEVLNKVKDTDTHSAWHNIKKKLQAEFENSNT